MMDNLARIISHGFAIVVVILLGIGFIYRGELFPDLELPDFLLPESERVADAGDNLDTRPPEMAVTQESAAVEPVVPEPSVPAATPVEAPATAPEARVETPEAAPAGVTVGEIAATPAAQATAETEAVTGTLVEPTQAPAEEVPPPAAEEPAPVEGAGTGMGEASRDATADSVPPPVPSGETPVEPQVEVPASGATTQAAGVTVETPSEPGITPDAAPQTGSQTPSAGEESYPPAATDEATAPTTGMAVPGSAAITAGAMQPSDSSTGQLPPRSSTTQAKPYELLAAAREAFWLHNYDDAEKNYRALTELEPQNPDGYGELGNMYFSQGRWDEAAAAYYQAGIRLISEGRLESARELVNVIRGLNGQQADELDKLITSAATTGNH
jgi:Tetratricopeptide repeat